MKLDCSQGFGIGILYFDNVALFVFILGQIPAHFIVYLEDNSGFSSNPRINLSPFTKDFRGEEHYNESID